MIERTGLYPGTFDPITNGHLDIISRAMKLVDNLVIGVAINRDKAPLFSLEDRVRMVEEEVSALQHSTGSAARVKVQPFETLLMHFAEEVNAHMIIRGLRAVSDFEYEFQMAGMNERLNPDIETVFLMAEAQHQAVASRLVKEIARLGGDVSPFTTPMVNRQLIARYAEFKGAS